MNKYENTGNMKVNRIIYSKDVYCNCEIGKEYYKGVITVIMNPGKYIMDYIDEENYIRGYNNKDYSGEVIVNDYFNHLINEYEPEYLRVILNAETSGHFPVEIMKETD